MVFYYWYIYDVIFFNILQTYGGLSMDCFMQRLDELFEEMVILRRHFHMWPELSHEEKETPAYIANYLRALNIEVREGVGGRGVVGKLIGTIDGPTIALRADFDALAIQELNEVTYKSKVNGVMHACGHDGHTAALLVLAKVLSEQRKNLKGTVVFIFQHAEELAPGGAIAMIEDGCLDGVDVIYGAHLWSPTPLGQILTCSGAIMAAADRFEIIIEGKGGHGAQPHEAIDPIVVASQFVVQLQSIISRAVDPLKSAVVSVGHMEASNPFNVIAQRVELKGTVRTFDEQIRTLIEQRIEQMLQGGSIATGTTYTYRYVRGYPTVVNDPKQAQFILQMAEELMETTAAIETDPLMIGEDFAYYLQHVPGAFFLVGAMPVSGVHYPHHHPRFNFEEKAMLHSAKVMLQAVLHNSN